MYATSGSIELLVSPWNSTFYNLVGEAEDELLVASPFLSGRPLKVIAEMIAGKHSPNTFRIDILTNLAVDSMLSGALDVAGLLDLVQSIPNTTVTYLPSLHAKIYVADAKIAVITSANLTNNGLFGNREYGVLLRDTALVSRVRDDIVSYASLGNTISLETLTALSQATEDLRAVRKQAERSINTRLKAVFDVRVEAAKLELLKARAKHKTTHGIFCDTILYLLDQNGPLTTAQLHPLIQQIHPDLCDDTIDRVIDGVHFGKKWKHYVRNAQQALKRQDFIRLDGSLWTRAV